MTKKMSSKVYDKKVDKLYDSYHKKLAKVRKKQVKLSKQITKIEEDFNKKRATLKTKYY